MTTGTFRRVGSPAQAAEGSAIWRWRERASDDQGQLDGLIAKRDYWRAAIREADALADTLLVTASEARQLHLARLLAVAEAGRRQLPALQHDVERQRGVQVEAQATVDRLWQDYVQLCEQIDRERDVMGTRLTDAQIADRRRRCAELVGSD